MLKGVVKNFLAGEGGLGRVLKKLQMEGKMENYTGLEAEWHDLFWENAEGGDAELALLSHLAERAGGKILELGCGSGRVLLELGAQGYAVEGVEQSEAMLALARERLSEAGLGIEVHLGKMQALPVKDGAYELVIVPAFTLQMLPEIEDLEAALSEAKRVLVADGALYFSLFIPWMELMEEQAEGEWYLEDEVDLENGEKARLSTRYEIDRMGQRLRREHRYEKIGVKGEVLQRQETEMRLRYYWLQEMRLRLLRAGWEVVQVWPDFENAELVASETPSILSILAVPSGKGAEGC